MAYKDAQILYNSKFKIDMKDDRLTRYFKCGMNKDGYWNSSHTNLQLEDAIVLMLYFHSFVFLFNQSSGNMKVRYDGLLVFT